MKVLARVVAACVMSVALVTPTLAAAPQSDGVLPQSAGGARIIDLTSAQAPVTGMQVFVPAGLDRQPRSRSGLAAVVAQTLINTPVDGVPLATAAARAGGSVNFTIDAQDTHFYLEATPDRFAVVASLFARALAQPDFSVAAVRAAAASVAKRADASSADGLSVGVSMVRSVYLAKTSAGLPTWGTSATIAQIMPSDVADFFRKNYVARGALIVAAGAPSPGLNDGERAVLQALPDRDAGPIVTSNQLPMVARSRQLITHRDIPAPWVVLAYNAPAPGSQDFAAVLVIESLIGQAVGRGLAPPLVATPSDAEKPVGSLYLYDSVPSAVIVYANGAGGDPTLAIRTVATVVNTLAASPLSQDELALAKAQATGDLLIDQATLADRSWLAGNFVREGAGEDYASRVLAAIGGLTPVQVQAAVKRYFTQYTTAIVLPRESHP